MRTLSSKTCTVTDAHKPLALKHTSIHTLHHRHMEKVKLTATIAFLAMAAFLSPAPATALVPYTRSIWDAMFPPDDPFRILEQSPLAVPRAADDSALALARADWRETSAAHEIFVDIPGMKQEDVKIEVEDDRVLRISGERKTEEEAKDERWHRVERTVGKFWRRFRMPADADMEKVTARLVDGVLRITVPKSGELAAKKEPKVISIVSDDKGKGSMKDALDSSKKEL